MYDSAILPDAERKDDDYPSTGCELHRDPIARSEKAVLMELSEEVRLLQTKKIKGRKSLRFEPGTSDKNPKK